MTRWRAGRGLPPHRFGYAVTTMPTYVYRCTANHEFEAIQRITEDPLSVCAECGGPVRRVVLPVGIVFKGSGFYKTDSRKSETSGVPAAAPAAGTSQEPAAAPNGNGAGTAAPGHPVAPPGPAPTKSPAAAPPTPRSRPAASPSSTRSASGGGGSPATTPGGG